MRVLRNKTPIADAARVFPRCATTPRTTVHHTTRVAQCRCRHPRCAKHNDPCTTPTLFAALSRAACAAAVQAHQADGDSSMGGVQRLSSAMQSAQPQSAADAFSRRVAAAFYPLCRRASSGARSSPDLSGFRFMPSISRPITRRAFQPMLITPLFIARRAMQRQRSAARGA